jgi:hypothetical protein
MNTTTILDIIVQLRTHAEGTSDANDATILADFIWMFEHGNPVTDTGIIWKKIINEFERLNCELHRLPTNYDLPGQLIYAVSGLMSQCLDYVAFKKKNPVMREQLLKLCWKIAVAWDAVLAGDIDNISEHVELEETCRN